MTQDYIKNLSVFYGVSTDYLLGIEETSSVYEENIPKDVQNIMNDSKGLTPEQRKIILNIIKEFKDKK